MSKTQSRRVIKLPIDEEVLDRIKRVSAALGTSPCALCKEVLSMSVERPVVLSPDRYFSHAVRKNRTWIALYLQRGDYEQLEAQAKRQGLEIYPYMRYIVSEVVAAMEREMQTGRQRVSRSSRSVGMTS